MSYTVALPDGRTVEFPDDVSKDKAAEIIKQQLGGGKPTGGILGALGGGAESQFSSARTGIESLLDANKAVEAAQARKQSIQSRYAEQPGWAEVEKAYKERGVFPAIGEYISQIPSAMAEQAPQMAASLAGARVGSLGGAPGAIIGAATPSYLQMYGANLERQAEEQRAAGLPVDVNRGTAALAAVPQTALDLAATYIPLGRSLIGKLLGKDVATMLEKGATKNVEKLAEESLQKTLLKGTGVGLVAEIPTEVMQQMLERSQAGLSLTSPDALAEYGQTAFQVSKLAPLGAAGRYSERAAAQDTVAQRRRAEEAAAIEAQQKAKAEQEAQQAAYRQTPEYLDEISKKYNDLTAQMAALDKAAAAKPDKNDLAAQAAVREARQQREALRNSDETRDIVEQYRAVAPQIKAQAEQAQLAAQSAQMMREPGAQADLFGLPSTEDRSPVGQLQAASNQIKELDTQIEKAQKEGNQQLLASLGNQRNQIQSAIQPLLPTRAELTEATTGLERMFEQTQTRMSEAKTTDEAERHARKAQELKSALDQLKVYDNFVEPAVDTAANAKKLKTLRTALNKAMTNGDQEEVLRLTPKIRELEQTTEAQGDLFGEQHQFRLTLDEFALAQQMAEGRENAKRIREQIEQETGALKRMGEQKGKRTPAEQAAHELRLEQARADLGQYNADQERLANAQEAESDWDRLVSNPADEEHQHERDVRLKELTDRVADLEAELERSPEREPTPQEKERAAWDIRSKEAVSQELAVAQEALADVQKRVALGDKHRRQGPVASTEILEATDARVADLLDRLLPGALKKSEQQTMSDRAALQREAKEASGERLSLLQEIDALHLNAKQQGEHTRQQIARLRALRDDYIAQGLKEANALRELNGAPALSDKERRNLSLELRAAVDELGRASIRRNADNSYEYGRVRGFTTERQEAEGALSAQEVTNLQNELSDLQQLKLRVLEPSLTKLREETDYLLRQGNRYDDKKFVNEKMNSPEIQALRQRIAMVDLRINELVPVIGAAVRGENIQTVVVPATVRGSDADLMDRAFGAGTTAFQVLEEQANAAVAGYVGKAVEAAAPKAKRVIELPIMSAQRYAMEKASAQSLLTSLNEQIRRAGNPKKPELVEARNMLVQQRNDVRDEIARLEKSYQRLVSLEQPTELPAGRAEPSTQDLFGPLEEERKDVAPLRKRLDELYAQRQQHQDRMQQRQQVATTPQMQALLEKFAKEPIGTPQLDEQIARLEEQLAAKTGKLSKRYSEFVAAREAERVATMPEEQLPSLEAFIDGLRRRGSLLSDDQLTELYWRNRAIRDQATAAEEAAPEQRMLPQFGLKQFTEEKKPVESGALEKARTQAVAYRSRIEGLRKALGRVGVAPDNGQFLSELETKVKAEIAPLRVQVELEQSRLNVVADLLTKLDREKKQRVQSPKNIQKLEAKLAKAEGELSNATTRKSLTDRYEALVAEQRKLANMVQMSKVQADSVKQKDLLEKELAKTETLYDNATKKVDTLERRQRAFEQQEAVRTGATPGTLEAQRIQAGEGYRDIEGRVRRKPKKATSWGITSVPKAQEAKPSEIAKAAAAVQQANSLVKAATAFKEEKQAPLNLLLLQNRKRLANLQAQVKALDPAANDTFGFDKTVEVQREIEALQAEIEGANPTEKQRDGGENIRTGIQLAREGWNPKSLVSTSAAYAADVEKARARVEEISKQLDTMGAQYEALRTKAAPEAAAFMDVDAAIQELFDKGIALDNEHSKAVLDYKVARRNLLVHQDEIGRFVRQEHVKAVAALQREIESQNTDTRVAAATKESQDAVARLEATQQRLKDAEAKLETERGKARAEARAAETPTVAKTEDDVRQARQRALLEGASSQLHELAGERFERDTTGALAEAAQNNAKKMLGMAQASLEKALKEKDGKAAAQAKRDINRYEKELAQAFAAGERTRTKLGEGATLAKETLPPVPGARLAPRKVGPLVKEARQAPGQFLGAKEDVPQGKQNPPRQAGTVRLRAADLNPQDANAVSLATLKQQEKVATGDRKADLKAALDNAVRGLTTEQVDSQVARGQELLKTKEALEVVALREKVREANEELTKASAALREASTPAAKEIAQDDVTIAKAQRDGLQRRLDAAKAAADKAGIDGATQALNAVNNNLIPAQQSEYKTAPGTQLSDKAVEEIEGGSLVYALNEVAKNGTLDFIRDNAAKLERFVRKTKIVVVPEIVINGVHHPAAYDPKTDTIKVTPAGFTQEDLVHESTHAATMRVLVMPESELTPLQREAKRELTAIFQAIKADKQFAGQYATKNLTEFAAEVQSNIELREKMAKKRWFNGSNAFIRFFQRLFNLIGFNTGEAFSDRAARYIEQMYLPSKELMVDSFMLPAAPRMESSIVGTEAGKFETLKGNLLGLSGRVQYVDRLAAAEEAILRAEGEGKLSAAQAMNANYFMRLSENVNAAAGQFITNGPVKIVSEDRSTGKEFRYAASKGANLMEMSEHAYAAQKASGLSESEIERMLTVSLAGDRANTTPNGWNRLRVKNAEAAKAEYEKDKAYLDAHPEVKRHIDAAKVVYKNYNNGLLDLAQQCGFLSKDEVERLKKNPYVPFYRIEDGVVKLYTGEEKPIRIGNIKDSPDLQRMVGSSEHILPIFTSAIQNTFMLTRMALRNKQQMETLDALYKAGFVSKMGGGPGPDNTSTVHYKLNGQPAFAVIDQDTFGIPAELIVKGMEGIKTTLPTLVKALGMPADLLRKMVTRVPAYAVRQIVRDPTNAYLLSGVDGMPVVNALKQLAKMRAGRSPAEKALMEGLAISSNIYSGDEKDMSMFLRDISAGKGRWDKAMGYLDTLALQADAATRAVILEDSLKKGLSQRDAEFRAFESQNFSRRGLSPTMQVLSTLIPFFNAQVQGLDVLYRSLSGKMPFAQQMEIQRKIMARGTLLMVGAMAYAMMMQDDDEYKKASPEERYGNFFVPIPGMKDKLKVPMPYEIGLLFMALPQALVDTAMSDTKAAEAIKGIGTLLKQSAPGVIPAAAKPMLEAFYGETAFGPIETTREKTTLIPKERYREETSEAAKVLGGFTNAINVSPIMIEHLVRGYTGSLGIAAMHMLDPLGAGPGEKASKPLSKSPLFGGLFQNPEGRFIIDRAYNRMAEIEQIKGTVENMIASGRKAEAKAFAQENARMLAMADTAGSFKQEMGQSYTDERVIRANPKLTQAQKDLLIEKINKYRNKMSAKFYEASEKTTRQ